MADGKRASDDDFSIIGSGSSESVGSAPNGTGGNNGNGSGRIEKAIDPAEARASGTEYTGGTNKDGSPTKKRGRKPGQTSSAKTENSPHIEGGDVEGTASILLAIHAFLAVQVPEMQMTEGEALDVAKAFSRVERHYPGVQKILSTKVKDHVAFFGVIGRVYGIRFAAIRARKAGEQAQDINPNAPNASVATPGPGHPNFHGR